MSENEWFEKDYYKILGVDKSASDDEIKKKYRKLARKYHPDQNQGDKAAEEKFKDITAAYDVLSKPEMRKKYDAFRQMAGGGARFQGGFSGAGSQYSAGGFDDIFSNIFGGRGGSQRFTYTSGANMNDIFSMFGGAGAQQSSNMRGASFSPADAYNGQNLRSSITIDFDDSVRGGTKKIKIQGKTLTINIPAGISDGKTLKIKGYGKPSPYAGNPDLARNGITPKPGDLLLTVHVKKHPYFTVENDNINIEVPVTYDELVLGTKISVPTVDGDRVSIKIPDYTANGTKFRVKGKGVKKAGKRGDMIVKVQVVIPQKLSMKAKRALKEFQKETQSDTIRDFLN